jgi:hypothetical protein
MWGGLVTTTMTLPSRAMAPVSRRRHHDSDVDNCRHQCGHENPEQDPDGGVVFHIS